MKIRGTCKRDGRDFMVEQVIASGGACPWDGEPFQPDYAVTLVNALGVTRKRSLSKRMRREASFTSPDS